MSDILTSGSAIERALICDASIALPHAHYESTYTRRGSAIHDYLEAVSKVGRDDALLQADEEYRDVCEQLNLEGLHSQLSLAAEISFAYNFVTKTARELGRGQGRAYDDVGDDEIPCTLDVVGVRDLPTGVRRGLYVEWKSGYSTRRKIALVAQIDFGALCVARTYGCDIVDAQLVHVHEDVEPWVQRRTISAWELDAFESELCERALEWRALRDRFIAGEMPTRFETGEWCVRCPAREFCPAQSTLVRFALSTRDYFDGPMRVDMATLDDAAFGQLWDDIHDAEDVLSMLKGRMRGIAAGRRIHLGKTSDGWDRWLGTIIGEGNEKLDGEHVYDVVAELHGDDAAMKATKVTATKKDLDAAIKEAVPHGKKAGALKVIYARLAKIQGAITTKVTTSIKETKTAPALEEKLRDTLDVLEAAREIERDGPSDGFIDEAQRNLDEGRLTAEDEATLALLDHAPQIVPGDLDP